MSASDPLDALDEFYERSQLEARRAYVGPPGHVFTHENEVDEVARALEEGRLAGERAQELAETCHRQGLGISALREALYRSELELELERRRRHHWQRRALTVNPDASLPGSWMRSRRIQTLAYRNETTGELFEETKPVYISEARRLP